MPSGGIDRRDGYSRNQPISDLCGRRPKILRLAGSGLAALSD
jgi:hypothetical protein